MKEYKLKKMTTTIILFIFFFLLFFIPFSLFVISRNQTHAKKFMIITNPTVQPSKISTIPISDTISPTSVPLVSIPIQNAPRTDFQTLLLEKIQNRIPLSNADLSAKNKIVVLLPSGQTSGVVFKGTTFTVDYVQDLDLFQVEVLITDTDKSKQDALQWFAEEGMSQQGICDLPIEFYLNSSVKNQISNPEAFNPLPVGC